jgi:hypothetical protein
MVRGILLGHPRILAAASEDLAFARLARHGDVAAHHASALAGDGKAQSSAAEPLRHRDTGLGEFLEQLRLLPSRHADTGAQSWEKHLTSSARASSEAGKALIELQSNPLDDRCQSCRCFHNGLSECLWARIKIGFESRHDIKLLQVPVRHEGARRLGYLFHD